MKNRWSGVFYVKDIVVSSIVTCALVVAKSLTEIESASTTAPVHVSLHTL